MSSEILGNVQQECFIAISLLWYIPDGITDRISKWTMLLSSVVKILHLRLHLVSSGHNVTFLY